MKGGKRLLIQGPKLWLKPESNMMWVGRRGIKYQCTNCSFILEGHVRGLPQRSVAANEMGARRPNEMD